MIYLTLEEVLYVAKRTPSIEVQVRDMGLLASAVARPQTSAFGEDAYPGIAGKASALMQSSTANYALVDGNKRLALAATLAFLGLNGWLLTMSNAQAYDLVIAVATGEPAEVAQIERVLGPAMSPASWTSPRS